jgi:hypothetical protein
MNSRTKLEQHFKPGYKWAILGFLLAYGIIFYLQMEAISTSVSSTAAINYIFLPISAAIAALPFAVIGYAPGAIIRARQTRLRRHVIIASVTALMSVAYLAYSSIDAVYDRILVQQIAQVEKMNDAELAELVDNDGEHMSRFVLAAVATHPAVSGKTLDRIAAIDDLALHERIYGSRELRGENRRGLAVMRLVATNPKVSPETLTLLSRSPEIFVLWDVAANSATPKAVLERMYLEFKEEGSGTLMDRELASNRATPEHILREIATSSRVKSVLENIESNHSATFDIKNIVRERIENNDYNY